MFARSLRVTTLLTSANVMLAALPAIDAEIQFLERRHSENPDGRFWVPLADRYRRVGKLEQAETLLREGLRDVPQSVSARIVLGQCLADLGRNGEAREQFRDVLASDPQNLVALRALGALASTEDRREEALHWYRELLAVDPMNEDAHTALGTLEAPPAVLSEESGGEPDGELVTETIAELYSQQGLHAHAAEVYRQMLQIRGEDPELRRRLDEAERLATETVADPPVREPTISEALRELVAWPVRAGK